MVRSLLVLVLLCATAAAKPTLEPYDAGTFSVSTPKGWTVQADARQGMVVAQQDPKRTDAPQVLLVVMATAQNTEDQLLDAIAAKAGDDRKVIKKGSLPGGGKQILVDGSAGGVKIRLGAVAVAAGGGMVLGVLISKPGDFDGLGGIELVTSMMGTIKPKGAPTAAASSTSGDGPEMTPVFDSYHTLRIQPQKRNPTMTDLAGEWVEGGNSVKDYYSTTTGNYAGYSVVQFTTKRTITAKGTYSESTHGARVSSASGAHVVDEQLGGSFKIDGDTITMRRSDNGYVTIYLVRGWFVGKDVVMMKLAGPFYQPPTDRDRNHDYSNDLGTTWTRPRR